MSVISVNVNGSGSGSAIAIDWIYVISKLRSFTLPAKFLEMFISVHI